MEPDPTPAKASSPLKPTVDVECAPDSTPAFAAILHLCGEHDLATGPAIAAALASIQGNVLVDLSACQFVDSTVISVLILDQQARQREGQRLEVLVPVANTIVSRTLEVAGVSSVLGMIAEMR
jgi:anti-anti-sigma factor